MQYIIQHFFPMGLIAIVIVVIGGISVGIYKVIKTNSFEEPNSYRNLIRNQTIYDELHIAELKKWFIDNQSLAKGNAVFFLAKPSDETSRMFALDHIPNTLDKEYSLLQVIVDDATNLPVAIRLISFSRMDNILSANLSGKNYVIVNFKKT